MFISESKCPYTIGGQIWLQKSNEVFLGSLTVELIRQVEKLGSISQAAKVIDISYQKAWTLIDQANRSSRLPLVIRQRGGNSGGGAAVTALGKKLMQQFDVLQHRFNKFIDDNMNVFEA